MLTETSWPDTRHGYPRRVIHLIARRIRPERRDELTAWLHAVGGPRRAEALASLSAEGIAHEVAVILESAEGPVLVYAMETDDLERARRVANDSPRPIDAEHRAVMSQVDGGAVDLKTVLDLFAEPAGPPRG